ncbi:hypothetical protein QTP88_011694 [Uroleucon formosanum]
MALVAGNAQKEEERENISYLGITVHWIEKGSFERQSYLLSIKRLTRSHPYNILARSMESVYTLLNINNKIIMERLVPSFPILRGMDRHVPKLLNHLRLNAANCYLYTTYFTCEVKHADKFFSSFFRKFQITK